jgi:hypothetical protein
MTLATSSSIGRQPRPSSLADVLEVVLDKGIVIDAYVRLALVGIEILTLDARIVIASVDTYLRFAEAANRLDLQPSKQAAGLPGLMEEVTQGGAKKKTQGALSGVRDTAREIASSVRGNDDESSSDDDDERREAPAERSAPGGRRGGRSE